MSTSTGKKIIVAIAGILLVASLAFVPLAQAATLKITQTAADGGENPASTIIITDENGGTVKTIDYAGGTATVEPVDLPEGTYYVTAEASGYVFNKQGGPLSASGADVSLKAYKPTTAVVQVSAAGVSDLSGIQIALYKGNDTAKDPKATATTNESGTVEFNDLIAGEYTLAITVPDTLASAGIPTTKAFTVTTSDGGGRISIDVSGSSSGDGSSSGGGSSTQNSNSVVVKAVDGSGNPLSGAQFSFYAGEGISGSAAAQGTTDSSGSTTVTGLADGTYTIRATQVPSGYSEPATQKVTVSSSNSGQTVTFTFSGATVSPSNTSKTDVAQTADPMFLYMGIGIVVIGLVGLIAAKRKLSK